MITSDFSSRATHATRSYASDSTRWFHISFSSDPRSANRDRRVVLISLPGKTCWQVNQAVHQSAVVLWVLGFCRCVEELGSCDPSGGDVVRRRCTAFNHGMVATKDCEARVRIEKLHKSTARPRERRLRKTAVKECSACRIPESRPPNFRYRNLGSDRIAMGRRRFTNVTAAAHSCGPTPRSPAGPYQGSPSMAQLLRHVDVTVCGHGQGRMRLLQLCTTPQAIARAMAQDGLAAQPPPSAARPPRVHASQLRLALH
jgi:hypothetical protein